MAQASGQMTADQLPTVLLADDDADIRQACREQLEDAGYVVVEVENGTDALAVLRHAAWGMVILLDDRMPGTTGSAIMQAVPHEMALQRHRYVLFTAGERSDRLRERVRQVTPAWLDVPVLGKPFDANDLVQVIAEAAARLK